MLLGGAGTNDTLSFAASTNINGIDADLTKQGTVDATRTGITTNVEIADGYRVAEFENLIGSAFDDELIGNTSANIIEGGAGEDTLIGGGGLDTLSYAGSA